MPGPTPTFVHGYTGQQLPTGAGKRSRTEIEVNPKFRQKLKEIEKVFLPKRKIQLTTVLLGLLPLFWYFGAPKFNIYLFAPKERENRGEKIIFKITGEKFPKRMKARRLQMESTHSTKQDE